MKQLEFNALVKLSVFTRKIFAMAKVFNKWKVCTLLSFPNRTTDFFIWPNITYLNNDNHTIDCPTFETKIVIQLVFEQIEF